MLINKKRSMQNDLTKGRNKYISFHDGCWFVELRMFKCLELELELFVINALLNFNVNILQIYIQLNNGSNYLVLVVIRVLLSIKKTLLN